MIRLITMTTLSLATTSVAGDILLIPPIDCDLTQTCYIQQTVDHDPGPGAQDFQCGSLSYDGHKGTDFALPTLAMQAAGVDVFAAASGTVRGVHDDMADVLQGSPGAPDVSSRECGNGIVVSHGDGWETQYCHLKQGSVTVQTGQIVTTGQVLGQVGLSGATQFPHVHLSVRKDGDVVDPFAPDAPNVCGDTPKKALWTTDVPFPAGGLILAGFSDAVPDYASIKAGTADQTRIAKTAPALVLWGLAFGGRSGDRMTLTIRGPKGVVFQDTQILERTQAQLFRAGGKRTPPGGWPAGDYTGTIELRRGDDLLDVRGTQVTLN
ncbi:M23 family metallopeptidase [Loktanella salsilacus]|uniref:M23 family metallopeptidase n=1 Tax=Loktanella salsilacus TaxID=195913 RepID=UPI003734EFDF